MRAIFFDLGDTLEHNDVLTPGAKQVLKSLRDMNLPDQQAPALGLISDFDMPRPDDSVEGIKASYVAILDQLDIRQFFEPVSQRVTLSTEVGVFKPDPKIFRTALKRIDADAHFHDAVFITENRQHVNAARELGMHAIHVKGPDQSEGDVQQLADIVPIVEGLFRFSPCCKKSSAAVGRHASEANKSKQVNPTIKGIVEQIEESRLKTTVNKLAAFETRWTYSSKVGLVTDWLFEQFKGFGYTTQQISFQPFTIPGGPEQRNVLCLHGKAEQGIILVCAHYDSLSETPGAKAPGADDDASGIAALLEIARIAQPLELKRRILYAAFGGEEQGLFGSAACAKIAEENSWPIELVINMDMIGWTPTQGPGARIVVEYDQGNKTPGNDAASKAFGLVMAQAAADYTDLAVEHTDIWNSDYMPFEAKGTACIGAYEGGDNPFYHQSTDRPEKVDYAYLRKVSKMVLATILTVGN